MSEPIRVLLADDEHLIRGALAALLGLEDDLLVVGVRGFAPKTTSARELAGIIRLLHSGKRYIASDLAADAIRIGENPLSPRERDVLELAADNAPIADIAARVGLSPGTVRNYLSSAVTKLDADNRHAAARLAREYGWI